MHLKTGPLQRCAITSISAQRRFVILVIAQKSNAAMALIKQMLSDGLPCLFIVYIDGWTEFIRRFSA